MDDLVGQILDTLEKTELSENTIVVFTSDHGWGNGPKDYVYKMPLGRKHSCSFDNKVPEQTQGGIVAIIQSL